jgi:acyl-CoA synthetase (AMP-forming)/AMP-acid ligase II
MPEVPANLATLLMGHPFDDDEPLLLTADRSVTAGAARTGARETAAALRKMGIRPGQAVAVQLPNSPEAVIAMFGCWLAGCVMVPLNPRAPDREVARILEQTGAAARITPDGLERSAGDRQYEEGTGFVLWTSGTTGAPKAILHRHDAYTELLDRILGSIRKPGDTSRPSTPNLIPVSLAQNAGIYNTLFGLRAGTAIVIMDRFDTAMFASVVRRFGIRSTVLPPTAIAMLNDDPSVTDLSPLRYVRSITAPLSPLQARRFTDRFAVTVLNSYGQAELGEVIGWTAPDARAFPEKVGAAGRPHAGVAVRIVDEADDDVVPGDVGRLLVRPPQRAVGYVGGSDLDDRVDAAGFVDTGDLARVDDDGFVWIEGRAGEVINRGGNKVFPAEVEEVLRLRGEVTDAAVVGVPDPRLGEVPVAFVTGQPVDAAELEAICRAHLAPYKVPTSFHHVDELPRSEIGKVLRAPLVALHGQLGRRRSVSEKPGV